jgi:sulfate/thiosulfate transport system permease protein
MASVVSPATIFRERRFAISWGKMGLRGVALLYLALLLLIPLGALLHDGVREGISGIWAALTMPIAWHALLLTLWTAALSTLINAVMGTMTAYVLVRHEFPGKSLLNTIVDLPLAIPTLVTGVMFVVLFGPQTPVGGWLIRNSGIHIIFAPLGIVMVLLFITFPFVVRSIQPVLAGMERDAEAAAATLGAGPWTIFRRVTLPPILLPLISGSLLAFARAIGEFGAIVLVAGNIPFHTQTAAVYVLGEIESSDQLGASVVSLGLLAIAFSLVLIVDLLQTRIQPGGDVHE